MTKDLMYFWIELFTLRLKLVAFEQKLNLWSLSGLNRCRLTLKVCPTKLSKNCLWILVRLDQSEVSIATLSTNHSSPGHTRGEVGPVLQQRHHLACIEHILLELETKVKRKVAKISQSQEAIRHYANQPVPYDLCSGVQISCLALSCLS